MTTFLQLLLLLALVAYFILPLFLGGGGHAAELFQHPLLLHLCNVCCSHASQSQSIIQAQSYTYNSPNMPHQRSDTIPAARGPQLEIVSDCWPSTQSVPSQQYPTLLLHPCHSHASRCIILVQSYTPYATSKIQYIPAAGGPQLEIVSDCWPSTQSVPSQQYPTLLLHPCHSHAFDVPL